MSAVVVDMYRGHEMEIDDGESKSIAPAAHGGQHAAGVHASVSVEDVHSFLAAHQKVGVSASSRSTRAVSDPPKRKRTSRTYQFNERDIRRYQQAKKEGRLRFPDLFMYHIQRPTDDVQREARMVRMHQEQQEAERIAAQIAEAAANGNLEDDAHVQVIGMDEADADQVKMVIMNQVGNAGIVTLGQEQQHSPHHCDESMALKSDAAAATAAGKSCVEDDAPVRVTVSSSTGVSAPAAGITKSHEVLLSKETKTKKTTKFGKIVLGEKFGKMGKKAIPVMIVAAAGFVSVVIITSSVGIGFAVAVPCAAITYGSIKLYEHCKSKKKLAKARKSGSAAESAPLAKIELADN